MSSAIVPTMDVSNRLASVDALMQIVFKLRENVLKPDVDYGTIPGTAKPTLLLPGMEKIMRALNAVPVYVPIEIIRDYDRPLFHFEYECRLVDADTGANIPGGRGMGLCTSYESAFRWRWVAESDVPEELDISNLARREGRKTESQFAFAIEKAETTGDYAKPAEYWQMWKEAIASGQAKAVKRKTRTGKEMDAYELLMGVAQVRIPNPDIFDQVNAIMKRGKKRSLGDAVKGAAAVSEFFTVDLEDFQTGDVVDGHYEDVPLTESTTQGQKPAGKSQPSNSGKRLISELLTVFGDRNVWWSPAMTVVVPEYFQGVPKHAENALLKMLREGVIQEETTAQTVIDAVKAKYQAEHGSYYPDDAAAQLGTDDGIPPARDLDSIPF